jgi:hypothetical protein
VTDPLLAAGGTQNGKVDGFKVVSLGQCVARQVRGALGMVVLVYRNDIHKQQNGTRGAVCARNWVGFRGMGHVPCVLYVCCSGGWQRLLLQCTVITVQLCMLL